MVLARVNVAVEYEALGLEKFASFLLGHQRSLLGAESGTLRPVDEKDPAFRLQDALGFLDEAVLVLDLEEYVGSDDRIDSGISELGAARLFDVAPRCIRDWRLSPLSPCFVSSRDNLSGSRSRRLCPKALSSPRRGRKSPSPRRDRRQSYLPASRRLLNFSAGQKTYPLLYHLYVWKTRGILCTGKC